MKISFSRHDRFRGADIEIELIEAARKPAMAAFFKISSRGDKADRELLHKSLTEWAAHRRINLRSRCDTYHDTHQANLRYWTHVSEFMSYWVGDRTFSRMLEDASRTAFRHELDLYRIGQQIAQGNAASAAFERRLTAAAKAFLEAGSSDQGA